MKRLEKTWIKREKFWKREKRQRKREEVDEMTGVVKGKRRRESSIRRCREEEN